MNLESHENHAFGHHMVVVVGAVVGAVVAWSFLIAIQFSPALVGFVGSEVQFHQAVWKRPWRWVEGYSAQAAGDAVGSQQGYDCADRYSVHYVGTQETT